MMKIGVMAFTDRGRTLAEKIMTGLSDCCADSYESTRGSVSDYVRENFTKVDGLIFVGAVGIAVRLISPYVYAKDSDPAVVVVEEKGNYVIPIISGHIGGANKLAKQIACITGGQAVITTATDVNNRFAVDVWAVEQGCVIPDISKIKFISSAVLRGEKAGFDPGGFEIDGTLPEGLITADAACGICLSLSGAENKYNETLNVVPRIVTLGVGCRKNYDSVDFERDVLTILSKNRISLEAVERLASVNLKKNEKCIRDFCDKYSLPFVTYTPDELMSAEGNFVHSDFVEKITGADNVCERSSVLASSGSLILQKTAIKGVTVAAAARRWKCRFR